MAKRVETGNAALPIAAVEYETGIGKDRLRAWERRYGFPAPFRDSHGDRLYSPDQVARLKLIKRLLDGGRTPRELLQLSESDLSRLLGPDDSVRHADPEITAAIESLQRGKVGEFDSWLRNSLLREGLERFVLGSGRSIVDAIGRAWETGCIGIWQEHYFSEQFSGVLRSAVANIANVAGRPKILLATPVGERHGLGLLMTHALFAARGAACLSLGIEIPNADISGCAAACRVDVVALSISVGYAAGRARGLLSHLRQNLPADTRLWVGGAAVEGLRRGPALGAITFLSDLEEGLSAIEAWRREDARHAPPHQP